MQLTGASKYGLALQPVGSDHSAAANGAVVQPAPSLTAADNPMLWLVAIGAVTLGLVAASTSVRVGPLRASVSAGKS